MKSIRLVPLVLVLFGFTTTAMFMPPTFVPVDRLLQNLGPHLKEKPEDPALNYTLARVHYLAFVHQSDLVGAFMRNKQAPTAAPDWMLGGSMEYHVANQHAQQQVLKKLDVETEQALDPEQRREYWKQVRAKLEDMKKAGWKPEPPGADALRAHAAAAHAGFQKVIKLDPTHGVAHLGLASFMEQYRSAVAGRAELAAPGLETITRNRIVDHYYQAYAVSINEHLRLRSKPAAGMRSLASYEAGKAFIRLVESEPPDLKNPAGYQEKLAAVKAGLKKLDQLPRGPITPLIFSLEGHGHIDELVDPEARVRFDLSGFGLGSHWPWPRPDTAMLVWDPAGQGMIRSGRQLFGNYTWQVIWEDGFAALRALDDDGDGWLAGGERTGIRAWFDRNSNGISEDGELAELDTLGVKALAVDPEERQGPHVLHRRGVRLENGGFLPLWDWVAEPGS